MVRQVFIRLSVTALLVVAFFGLFSKKAFGAVLINEIYSGGSSGDWIELYADEETDITGWKVEDGGQHAGNLSSCPTLMLKESFCVVDMNNLLDKAGDSAVIKGSDGNVIDQISYGSTGDVCAPRKDDVYEESVGRYPDGGNTIERFSSPTPKERNSSLFNPCPTPTANPTSTPTSSPTSAPTSTPEQNAEVLVKEAVDGFGNALSSVKIYINGDYTNHYTPENFSFCDDCEYDFGTFTFRFEKSGYDDHTETHDINAGDNFSISPVLRAKTSGTVTSTPKATSTAKASATPKAVASPTPTGPVISFLSPSPEANGEVLGMESLGSTESTSSPVNKSGGEIPLYAFPVIGLGALLMGTSVFLFVRTKKNEKQQE